MKSVVTLKWMQYMLWFMSCSVGQFALMTAQCCRGLAVVTNYQVQLMLVE